MFLFRCIQLGNQKKYNCSYPGIYYPLIPSHDRYAALCILEYYHPIYKFHNAELSLQHRNPCILHQIVYGLYILFLSNHIN